MTDKEKLAQELINRMNELLTAAHKAGISFSFITSRDGRHVKSNEDSFKFYVTTEQV